MQGTVGLGSAVRNKAMSVQKYPNVFIASLEFISTRIHKRSGTLL